jgi:hypothetical protein
MVSMGTAAGSSAPSILTAIAKASLSADAVIVPMCVATAFRMTAAGKINFTVATGPLTAGVTEVWVLSRVLYTTARRNPMSAWAQQSGLANAALLT